MAINLKDLLNIERTYQDVFIKSINQNVRFLVLTAGEVASITNSTFKIRSGGKSMLTDYNDVEIKLYNAKVLAASVTDATGNKSQPEEFLKLPAAVFKEIYEAAAKVNGLTKEKEEEAGNDPVKTD